METPVLLVIFNRPEKTRAVFEEIRRAKPQRLFIAADGPRNGNQQDVEKCKESRSIVENIDWPCEIFKNYSEENMGCDLRVPTAITWMFEKVSEGIILEDDCLPSPDFFVFCQELLGTYKHEPMVYMISGNNFQNGTQRGKGSFYFSRYANTWGWATWKRAWNEFQFELRDFNEFKKERRIEKILSTSKQQAYWTNFFEKIQKRKYTFWDAKWTFSIWNKDGISIVPNINLVDNIGHGESATHTKKNSITVMPGRGALRWPLVYPTSLSISTEADNYIFDHVYTTAFHKKLISKLASVFGF